jgi:hypothetical protein
MGQSDTQDARIADADRRWALHALFATVLIAAGTTASPPAFAQRGCLILLCLAAPNWRAVPQCVPPIRQLLRDLSRGRPFPTCPMSGAGNTARNQWAYAPGNCPPQYTRLVEGDGAPTYICDYTGAVSVTIDGSPWSRTWWSFAGDTVTEFMPSAKAQLGTWDTRFDDDHATWLASQAPRLPACPEC